MNKNDRLRRALLLILCMAVAIGAIALYISSGESGAQNSTARDYVMENHSDDTTAGNPVTAVYLNYRLWDTLFESLILIVSVLAVINLSWSGTRDREDK